MFYRWVENPVRGVVLEGCNITEEEKTLISLYGCIEQIENIFIMPRHFVDAVETTSPTLFHYDDIWGDRAILLRPPLFSACLWVAEGVTDIQKVLLHTKIADYFKGRLYFSCGDRYFVEEQRERIW